MEENRADLPENSTAETESQPITKAISFTPTETNETAATTAPTEKKPAWKKILGAIGDIVLVCVIVLGINAYYTDKNFILLFPDSYAPASPELTFIELHGTRGTYEKKKGWLDFLWKKEEQN